VLREICAHASAIADVGLSEPWLAALPIGLTGNDEQKSRYLAKYLQGHLLPAFALSEPDAGPDASALPATARLGGTHSVLNSRKTRRAGHTERRGG
jgi:acyl-CoA dehydrogenase